MMVMPFLIFFWRGFPSMDGFFLPLSPPFSSTKFLLFCLLLLFCRIATAQNFSLFPGRLLDFVNKREILIVLSIGVEYQNEEGKYPHTTQRRGLSLLFSSLLSRNTKKKKKALHHRYTHEHTTRAMLTTTTMSTTGSSSSFVSIETKRMINYTKQNATTMRKKDTGRGRGEIGVAVAAQHRRRARERVEEMNMNNNYNRKNR